MRSYIVFRRHLTQLDPPESEQLFFRSASVSFLFPHVWLLAPTQQGKFLRMFRRRCSFVFFGQAFTLLTLPFPLNADIVTDLLAKVEKGVIKPSIKAGNYSLDKIRKAQRDAESVSIGKVVIKL